MFNFINLDGIPILPKRENNIDKFCMYLMLNTKNNRLVLQWKYQPYLKRNMELYKQINEGFSHLCRQNDQGISLAQFWRCVALNEIITEDEQTKNQNRLAWEHLASYFEDKCYWAAKHICKNDNQESWEEYLYLARLMIHNPLKLADILQKYDSQQSNIDTYITEALENNIKFEAQVQRFSRWRLLCKKSDKELKEALQISGYKEPEISQFIFAKKYFKQVYLINKVKNPARKTGKKWPEPDSSDFEKTAQCYNAEKILPSAPHEVLANSSNITVEEIAAMMENCIAALQNYPKSILPQFSLDALQSVGREVNLEPEFFEPPIEETAENSPFLISQVDLALRQQLSAMKLESKKILLLYYGWGLTQQQLAAKLEINQSTISRYLAKSTIKLLQTLAEISQPQGWVKEYVVKWLKREFLSPLHSDLIQAVLISAIKKLTATEREVLQLFYGQEMSEIQIAQKLNISQEKAIERLDKVKYNLQENLLQEINLWIKEFIEKWLSKHYKSLVNSILLTLNSELESETKINTVLEIYLQNQKVN